MVTRKNGTRPRLMTSTEVGAAFHVGRQTVQRWSRMGWLHPIRTPGHHYRFFYDEVQAVLSECPLSDEELGALRTALTESDLP
jgi:hypothetical protein